MEREELTAYDCNEGSYDSMGFPWQYKEMVYDKAKADAVMDAMETRIKELEAEIEMDAKKRRIMIDGYNRKCERVKELEEVISKKETTTPKWISVNDVKNRPNEKGDYVLVCDYVNRTRGTAIYQNGKFTLTTCGIAELNITHWMPLPPPPTTEEK